MLKPPATSMLRARCRALCAPLLALGALLSAPTTASATRPLAPPQPMRCAATGLCMTATEAASLMGAYQQDGQELQFEAIYRPYTQPVDEAPYPYPAWCVRLTQPSGEVYVAMWGNPRCLGEWHPNYRDPMTSEESAASLARIRNEGPIVFAAQQAAAAAVPPAGRQEAWEEVVKLFDHLADTVTFHGGQP